MPMSTMKTRKKLDFVYKGELTVPPNTKETKKENAKGEAIL